MTARATHARADVPADSGNPDEIQPSDFIADHVLEDIASAADLAAITAHVGPGGDSPFPSSLLVDDGTGYSQWRDAETWFASYERRTRTVNARIQSPALMELVANPVVLLANPPSGYFYRVLSALTLYTFGTVPFTQNSNVYIGQNRYRWLDVTQMLGGNGSLVDVIAPWVDESVAFSTIGSTLVTDLAGPVYLVAEGDELSGGDGQVDVWLDYQLLPLPVVD